MNTKEKKYPAGFIVHWATGEVACCKRHANALVVLGGMLGTHVPVSYAEKVMECINCKQEAESKN